MIRRGRLILLNPFRQAWKRNMASLCSGPIYFGSFEVTSQVFLTTPSSYALVNLKPLLPGHVLVCPLKSHKRLTDLSAPELTDLFQAVQRVQHMLARHYFHNSAPPPPPSDSQPESSDSKPSADGTPEAGAFNIAIQDGFEAGQTVPHLHVHVIPRIRGATAKDAAGPGDAIYEEMAREEGNVGGALWDAEVARLTKELGERPTAGGEFRRIEDAERHPRTAAEMREEAELFRRVLEEMEREESKGRERN
ncbi:HIT-like domain-containing protein [Xylariaceae sp. FL0662B]|nr:HIT-like domain-containing protein [Xylariaceae sp. FL0662B]